MREFSFEVSGKKYKGSTASAVSQFDALHLAGRTGFLVALKEKTSDMSLVATLSQIPAEDTQKLIELLVVDKVKTDNGVPVAENLFGDDIQDYYLLVAKTVKENIGNFWKLRQSGKENETSAEKAKQKKT